MYLSHPDFSIFCHSLYTYTVTLCSFSLLIKGNPCPHVSQTNFSSLCMYLCFSNEVCVLNPLPQSLQNWSWPCILSFWSSLCKMFMLSSAVEPCLWHVLEISLLSSVISSYISAVSGMCIFSSAVWSCLSHVFEIFLLSSLLSSKLSDCSGMCLFSSIVLSCLCDVSQIYLLFSLVLSSLFISFNPSDVCVCFVMYYSTFSVTSVTNLSN